MGIHFQIMIKINIIPKYRLIKTNYFKFLFKSMNAIHLEKTKDEEVIIVDEHDNVLGVDSRKNMVKIDLIIENE